MKSRRYISIAILMILFIVLISNISNATDLDSIYVWSNNTQNTITTSAEPENQRTGNFLNLTCGSAILMEQMLEDLLAKKPEYYKASELLGTILYDHNMHEQLRPASVTKVMTILLIMEALDNRNYNTRRQCPLFRKCKQNGWFANMA